MDDEGKELLAELLGEYIGAIWQGSGTDPDSADFDHMFLSTYEDAPEMIARVREYLGRGENE